MCLAVKEMAIFVNAVQTPEGRQEPATAKRSAESGISSITEGSPD
jgi:hypothetical protein